MGARFYCYFTDYQENVAAALQTLRETEFKAGRYLAAMYAAERSSINKLTFPPNADSPAPGPVHASIQQALRDCSEEGTRSIIDIAHIADEPDLCTASPLTDEDLVLAFETTCPTRDRVEGAFMRANSAASAKIDPILDCIGRGQARYVIVYNDGKPSEIFFMGYSFD